MTDPSYTHVSFVLDESGSMGSLRGDTIGGFNTTMADQRKDGGKLTVSLVKFNTAVTRVFSLKDSREVEDLTEEDYCPGGGTALLDALGTHINELGEELRKLPAALRPGKVVVVVMTDGHENSSREFSHSQVGKMVRTQEDEWKWNFIFMGANLDAFAEAGSLGIRAGNALNYSATAKGTQQAYGALSRGLLRSRSADVSANSSFEMYAGANHVDDLVDKDIPVKVTAGTDENSSESKSDSTERV